MSHGAEHAIQKTDTSTVQQTSFEDDVKSSYALQTDGEWISGWVENVRLRPRFTVIGHVVEEPSDAKNAYKSRFKNVSELRDTRRFNEYRPESTAAPFITIPEREIPFERILFEDIDVPVRRPETIEELYTLDAERGEVAILEFDQLRGRTTTLKLLVDVDFELIGELTSQDLLHNHPVVLTNGILSDRITSRSYYDDARLTQKLEVEYKYTDDELMVKYFPNGKTDGYVSSDTFKDSRFKIFQRLGVFGLYLLGAYYTVSSVSALGDGVLSTLATIAAFTVYTYIAYEVKRHARSFSSKHITTDEQTMEARLDTHANPSRFARPVGEAYSLYEEKKRVQAKTKTLEELVSAYPRTVVVTPDETGSCLHAVDRDLSWDISESGVISGQSLQFFIEHGFENDLHQIETHMVKDKASVPNHLPAIQDTSGTWFLLPEKVQPPF